MVVVIFWLVILSLVFLLDFTSLRHQIFNFLKLLICVILFLTFAFQIFVVPSSSMAPTLVVGDYVLVSKYAYGYNKHSMPVGTLSEIFFLDKLLDFWNNKIFYKEPQYNDVVVFKNPADHNTYYVKRLVGLPGDTVQMINGELYVNNVKLARYMLNDQVYVETGPNGKQYLTKDLGNYTYDNTAKFVVPEDSFFFLGDNRDNSLDSRSDIGMINKKYLVGRVDYYMWSINKNVSFIYSPIEWIRNASFGKFMRLVSLK